MLNPLPGVVVGGRYLLVRPLAKGGMGSVWIARHRDLDIDVSVKFMAPSLLANEDLRARFEREAKVAARLISRHIVKVLDYGADDRMPYIAMELLRGESLADRIAREGRLSVGVARHLIEQICKALRVAHDEQLVHRDLKPGNIFLALEDNEEVVKVLDFGIVKETGRRGTNEARLETDTGIAMGSVHYMSPEQIRSSRSVDARSDLWSVAVILYKMLTGDVPFPGTAHGDVMVRVCTDPLVPPSFVVPGLPKEIDAFFARALTRDPAGRYQSANEFAAAFDLAASLVPSDERVPGNSPRGWKKTIELPRLPLSSHTSVGAANSAVQTRPFPTSRESNEPSFVSAALEKTAGTFQAVTMPKAISGVMRAETPSSAKHALRAPRALVWIGVLAVILGAGIAGIGLTSKWGAASGGTGSAGASAIALDTVASPPSTEMQAVASPSATVTPMVSVSSSSSVAPKQEVVSGQTAPKTSPTNTAPTTTGLSIKTAPKSTRRNPLDDPN